MAQISQRVLILTFDVIGPRLGGAAIRVLGLARGLRAAGHLPTILTSQLDDDSVADGIAVHPFEAADARPTFLPLLEKSDVTILPLHGLKRLPFLRRTKIPLVFDIYDPVLFELMATKGKAEVRDHVQLLNSVLRRGDFFLCATERQRDYWLDALVANGRLDAHKLIEVVPFGIDPAPPPPPASQRTGKNIVWPGGIWDWMDPETLLQAMRILARTSPGIRLTFFAGKHPGSDHSETAAARLTRQTAGANVHLVDDYIPYAQRGSYLTECDAAVSTHRANLESHFAYRTRLLDCIWAGLPIVCTEGDYFAELVVRRQLGLIVPPENPEALAQALQRITTDVDLAATCRANLVECRKQFDWSAAVQPLARFCAEPRITHIAPPVTDVRTQLDSAQRVLSRHGARETLRRLKQHLRNR